MQVGRTLPAPVAAHQQDLAALGATSVKATDDSLVLTFADAAASRTAQQVLQPKLGGLQLQFEPKPAGGRAGIEQVLSALEHLPGVVEVTRSSNASQPVVVRTFGMERAEELSGLLRSKVTGRELGFTFSTPPDIALGAGSGLALG